MNKIIQNEIDYQEALLSLEQLMERNPAKDTPDYDELGLLAILIKDYETRFYQFSKPEPIEAIKFRMEQQNLMPRDLIPIIGSRSKVSEVLSGKRQLTLSMIRALNSKLGIPASVLIQGKEQDIKSDIDWERFPIKQMLNLGWIKTTQEGGTVNPEEVLRPFFATVNGLQTQAVFFRLNHVRSARSMDEYALMAWSAQVLKKAKENSEISEYKTGTLTIDFLHKIAQLSVDTRGPLLARDFLRENGIQLIIERHLPGTYLDGAAFILRNSNPVIGLTLRYDRIDNFWFTLMHELAHITLQSNGERHFYYDDLDTESEDDLQESEADKLAGEALIPTDIWRKSPASTLRSPDAAEYLARQLNINPAIVAGRMRREFKAYRLLNNLVGHGEVRKLFPDVNWE